MLRSSSIPANRFLLVLIDPFSRHIPDTQGVLCIGIASLGFGSKLRDLRWQYLFSLGDFLCWRGRSECLLAGSGEARDEAKEQNLHDEKDTQVSAA